MTDAAKTVIEAFEALDQPEREEVAAEILRRVHLLEHASPDDRELLLAADQIFLELERREARG